MAVNIAMQRRQQTIKPKESELAKALAVGGGVVGGVLGSFGSPAGAIAGASGGASLGGMVGGMLDPGQPGRVVERGQNAVPSQQDTALARKLAASREDRLAVLRQAEAALPQLPPELRQEYAGTIVRATMEEEKRRAMGMGA